MLSYIYKKIYYMWVDDLHDIIILNQSERWFDGFVGGIAMTRVVLEPVERISVQTKLSEKLTNGRDWIYV